MLSAFPPDWQLSVWPKTLIFNSRCFLGETIICVSLTERLENVKRRVWHYFMNLLLIIYENALSFFYDWKGLNDDGRDKQHQQQNLLQNNFLWRNVISSILRSKKAGALVSFTNMNGKEDTCLNLIFHHCLRRGLEEHYPRIVWQWDLTHITETPRRDRSFLF